MFKPRLDKNQTTYMGVLIKTLLLGKGDVVELGTSTFSTPLLHWVCKEMDRKLTSYESDRSRYDYARQFVSKTHSVKYVQSWDKIDTQGKRNVVLIHPNSKTQLSDIDRFKKSADYIVVPNSQALVNNKVVTQFRNVYTWKDSRPWVTVLSNSKSLSRLS